MARAHRRVDRGGGRLPRADELDEDKRLHARSITLSSNRLGLIAKLDLIEAENGQVVPVDYTRGKRPHVEKGAHEPERVKTLRLTATSTPTARTPSTTRPWPGAPVDVSGGQRPEVRTPRTAAAGIPPPEGGHTRGVSGSPPPGAQGPGFHRFSRRAIRLSARPLRGGPPPRGPPSCRRIVAPSARRHDMLPNTVGFRYYAALQQTLYC